MWRSWVDLRWSRRYNFSPTIRCTVTDWVFLIWVDHMGVPLKDSGGAPLAVGLTEDAPSSGGPPGEMRQWLRYDVAGCRGCGDKRLSGDGDSSIQVRIWKFFFFSFFFFHGTSHCWLLWVIILMAILLPLWFLKYIIISQNWKHNLRKILKRSDISANYSTSVPAFHKFDVWVIHSCKYIVLTMHLYQRSFSRSSRIYPELTITGNDRVNYHSLQNIYKLSFS